MILEGDHSVIDAIKEKKRLMDAGEEHGHINIMVIAGGGSLKAAYSGGVFLALAELGYEDCFHTVVGSSSGTITAAYFLSGNALQVESLFREVACSKNFLNLKRPFNVLNTKYLRSVLEDSSDSGLNIDRILNHSTEFKIALSNFESAEPYLLVPKTAEEIYEGLRATISMPGAVCDPVFLRGIRYVDGESAVPYNRKNIYSQKGITHILDLTNQEKTDTKRSLLEVFLYYTIYFWVTNKKIREASYSRIVRRSDFFKKVIHNQPLPICVVWGSNSVGSFEANPKKLKAAVDQARSYWHQILS